MSKPTDTYPILVGHLEPLVTVLDAAYTLALAEDLARQARNLRPEVQQAALTVALEAQRDRFEAYLSDATAVEPVEVSNDE